ncbi:MAG TPA: BMP family ABC transporter substrate-binding protein [Polyangia bacterium]|nr:BMP family ABC transporter substrate-binding protein [Polyangia bacterium]
MRAWALWMAALLAVNLVLLVVRTPGGRAGGRARLKVGLVFDVGGRGDKSFNDLAYAAIRRATRELAAEAQYIEPGEGSDREAGIRLLAAQGFDLVVAAGFLFSDDMYAVAREYPHVHFACIDYAKFGPAGFIAPPPNMVALKFREEEGSYLVGALAALTSRTRTIGFVGGMDIPLIHKFEAGYVAGAAAVCPGCRVLVGYAGVTGEAFKNPGKGKELALAQYEGGADVIFHASGSTGLGVFEAARQTGRLAIGVDADQWDEAPGHILTSMLKRADVATFEIIRDLAEGRWQGGVRTFGLRDRGVDYVYDARNAPLIPAAARSAAERLRAEIVAGRTHVPTERSR